MALAKAFNSMSGQFWFLDRPTHAELVILDLDIGPPYYRARYIGHSCETRLRATIPWNQHSGPAALAMALALATVILCRAWDLWVDHWGNLNGCLMSVIGTASLGFSLFDPLEKFMRIAYFN